MKSVQLKKLAVISTLLALAGLAFMPAVFAMPINPNLSWSPNPTASGSTTTATFGVNDVTPTTPPTPDGDCPSGDTFTGTLTVTEPAPALGVATYAVAATPCGDVTLSAVYPTAFTGVAATTECGVYTATWSGVTSATVATFHPAFSLTDDFIVNCSTTGVPQFTAPLMLVAAFGLVLVAAAKKGRLLKL
jgi:hypothetical protein